MPRSYFGPENTAPEWVEGVPYGSTTTGIPYWMQETNEPQRQPETPYYPEVAALREILEKQNEQAQLAKQMPQFFAPPDPIQHLKLAGAIMEFEQDRKRMSDLDRKRQADAIRFQGMQEYQNLMQQGLSHKDAFSRTANKLYYDNPAELMDYRAKMEESAQRQNFRPVVEDIDGVKMVRASPNGGYVMAPRPRVEPNAPAFKPNPAETKIAGAEFTAARKAFDENPNDAAISNRFVKAQQDLRKVYTPSVEKVVVIKDGKRYRLPKSQLKEAQKQGFKLAE